MAEQINVASSILALRKESLDNNNHQITKVVGKQLSQYGFNTLMVHEVMNEVCVRAAKSSKPINNPEAWFKVTSLNIVREKSRDRDRIELIDSDEHCNSISIEDLEEKDDVVINGQTIDNYSPYLKKAWKELLSSEERRILSEKILKDKNWREVAEAIANYNGEPSKEATIRQKGHRALKKLKQAFDDLQPTGEPQ